MKGIAVYLIALYQRYISPYKGYRCAYSALYNNGSCSTKVQEIIETKGMFSGWHEIEAQFTQCTQAYSILLNEKKENKSNNKNKKEKSDWCDPIYWCDPSLDCDAINCIPRQWCRGDATDASCDLPCDCSPF